MNKIKEDVLTVCAFIEQPEPSLHRDDDDEVDNFEDSYCVLSNDNCVLKTVIIFLSELVI